MKNNDGQNGRLRRLAASVEPCPDRAQYVQRWHADQIIDKTSTIGLVHVAITSAGTIRTQLVGVEPEMAGPLLEELDLVAKFLRQLKAPRQAAGNVLPIPVKRSK